MVQWKANLVFRSEALSLSSDSACPARWPWWSDILSEWVTVSSSEVKQGQSYFALPTYLTEQLLRKVLCKSLRVTETWDTNYKVHKMLREDRPKFLSILKFLNFVFGLNQCFNLCKELLPVQKNFFFLYCLGSLKRVIWSSDFQNMVQASWGIPKVKTIFIILSLLKYSSLSNYISVWDQIIVLYFNQNNVSQQIQADNENPVVFVNLDSKEICKNM